MWACVPSYQIDRGSHCFRMFTMKITKRFTRSTNVLKGSLVSLARNITKTSFGSITVSVLVNDDYDHEQEEKLISNVKARLGSSMQVNIDIVETLLRSKNGKVIQAICTIEDDEK